jgi:hypothetical protein
MGLSADPDPTIHPNVALDQLRLQMQILLRDLPSQPGHVQRFCVIPYVRLSLHREKKESEGGHLKGLPNVKKHSNKRKLPCYHR